MKLYIVAAFCLIFSSEIQGKSLWLGHKSEIIAWIMDILIILDRTALGNSTHFLPVPTDPDNSFSRIIMVIYGRTAIFSIDF